MSHNTDKATVKKQMTRLLRKHQVYSDIKCQIESCDRSGSLTLINQSPDVTKEEINKEEVFFLCRSHKPLYRQSYNGVLSEVNQLDPDYQEILNLTPIKISSLLVESNPRPVTNQAIRQKIYRYLTKKDIKYTKLQCIHDDCMDKAYLFIPDFNKPTKIKPMCYFHNDETPDNQTIDLKTDEAIEILRQAQKNYTSFKNQLKEQKEQHNHSTE